MMGLRIFFSFIFLLSRTVSFQIRVGSAPARVVPFLLPRNGNFRHPKIEPGKGCRFIPTTFLPARRSFGERGSLGESRGKGKRRDVGDNRKQLGSIIGFAPPITEVIVLANIIIYCIQMKSAYAAHEAISKVYRTYGVMYPAAKTLGLPMSIPQRVVSVGSRRIFTAGAFTKDFMFDPDLVTRSGQLYRMITAAFLHSGITHLGLNMYQLVRNGATLEALGGVTYLGVYVFSAVTGNVASLIVPSPRPGLGASGGICGLYGYLGAHFWRIGALSQFKRVIGFMGFLLFYGLCSPNVGNAAHMGGFVGGAVAGYLCGPRMISSPSIKKPKPRESRRSSGSINPTETYGPPLVRMAILQFGLLCLVPPWRRIFFQTVTAARIFILRPGALSAGVA